MTTTNLIRIGVMGTHSTGKSLLMRRIEMELRGRDIPVARTGGLGRRAAQVPLPKMHNHTVESTRWILATGIADEVAAAASLDPNAPVRVVLADRASWDALAYHRAALEWRGHTASRTDRESLHSLAAAVTYDLLFATVLNTTIPAEPKHDYDDRYRRLVDQHTRALLNEENLPHVRVTSRDDSKELAIAHALHLCSTEAPV
ncbi:AAA family ATPase [Streptomyces microflavus]|uniref:AAA family ATPase n=1 Tax=Streptomyces microflavus TaxID=1919 RepID=UPI0033F3FD40